MTEAAHIRRWFHRNAVRVTWPVGCPLFRQPHAVEYLEAAEARGVVFWKHADGWHWRAARNLRGGPCLTLLAAARIACTFLEIAPPRPSVCHVFEPSADLAYLLREAGEPMTRVGLSRTWWLCGEPDFDPAHSPVIRQIFANEHGYKI